MKPWHKILAVVGVLLLTYVAVVGVQFYSFKDTPMSVNGEQLVVVAPGEGLGKVAWAMKAQGLIAQPRFFSLWGRIQGTAGRIHVGEYRVEPGMTPLQLLARMVKGEVVQYSLTLVDGWNLKQVMQAVDGHPKLKQTLAGKTAAEIAAAVGIDGGHPEGWFFPDTYYFPAGMSDVEFLKRAYKAMKKRLSEEWSGRADGLPYKNAYEALIMASIVEKETAVPSERSEVAGVFVRRLQKNMRLQTDPTVIYGMGDAYDGNIRRRDLKRDTPYNTYTRHGLPPTPIAMPGGAAIHATLHPADGETLYFVARGDGSHYFSKTLKEHINAVRKYQLKRK